MNNPIAPRQIAIVKWPQTNKNLLVKVRADQIDTDEENKLNAPIMYVNYLGVN